LIRRFRVDWLTVGGLQDGLQCVRDQVRFRPGVGILVLPDGEQGKVGRLGEARSLWLERLLRQIAAGSPRVRVNHSIDAVIRWSTGRGEKLDAGVLADQLQPLKIDRHNAIKRKPRPIQADLEREVCNRDAGGGRLLGRWRFCCRGRLLGRVCGGFLGGNGSGFAWRRCCGRIGSGGAHLIRRRLLPLFARRRVHGTVGKDAVVDRGKELGDRIRVGLIDRGRQGKWTGAANGHERGRVDRVRLVAIERKCDPAKLKRLTEHRWAPLLVQEDETKHLGAGIDEQLRGRVLLRIGVDGIALVGRRERGKGVQRDVVLGSRVGVDGVPRVQIAELRWFGETRVCRQWQPVRSERDFRQISRQRI
jgi:hypothetical protein